MEEVHTNQRRSALLPLKMSLDQQKPKPAESWSEMIQAWPKSTLLIVSTEFCERFSFYGMRVVLTLYLLNVLKFSQDTSTMFFNGFAAICYTSPVLGSILADGYIGKFMTIFIISVFYALGQIVLAAGSIAPAGMSIHPYLDIAGLMIVAISTGGIKPCVSAFGGDQFEPFQEKMISLFFSVFYFSINAGAMISTFVSPIFRVTPCLGQDSCYPLAFGVPAILMILSTVIFISGSCWYKKTPPKVNVIGEVCKVIKKALENRWKNEQGHGGHWLDFYFDTHNCERDVQCVELRHQQRNNPHACQKKCFVGEIKSLVRILVILIPAPMVFWSLFDQQGSRWMIQALHMDSRIWNSLTLLPDQMPTLNAVLILLFIPLFQFVIYPIVSIFFKITPLRKMVAGGFLMSLTFIVSAAIQFKINNSLPNLPSSGRTFVSVINAIDECQLDVTMKSGDPETLISTLTFQPNEILTNDANRNFDLSANTHATFSFNYSGASCANQSTNELPLEVEYDIGGGKEETFYLLVAPQGTVLAKLSTEKPMDGAGEFKLGITLALNDSDYSGNLALCRVDLTNTSQEHPCDMQSAKDFYVYQAADRVPLKLQQYRGTKSPAGNASIYGYKSVRPGRWGIYILKNKHNKGANEKTENVPSVESLGVELDVEGQGGVYMVAVTGNRKKPRKRVFQVVQDNNLSIVWQVPQYVILTAAEILFSITGLEFAYSQSAPSMKSLVGAIWLLTTAFGNVLIVVITYFHFQNMAIEFLFYAALMIIVTVVLALLAIFYYEYNDNGRRKSVDDTSWECATTVTPTPDSPTENKSFASDKEQKM